MTGNGEGEFGTPRASGYDRSLSPFLRPFDIATGRPPSGALSFGSGSLAMLAAISAGKT